MFDVEEGDGDEEKRKLASRSECFNSEIGVGQGKVYGVSIRVLAFVDEDEEEDGDVEAIEKEANEEVEEELGKQSLGRVKLSKEEAEGQEECPPPPILLEDDASELE